MVASQIFIPLVEPPGNGKAGDNASEKVFGFVCAQNGSRGTIQITLPRRIVKGKQSVLPVFPVHDIVLAKVGIVFEQGGTGLLSRLAPHAAESQGEDELSAAGCKI